MHGNLDIIYGGVGGKVERGTVAEERGTVAEGGREGGWRERLRRQGGWREMMGCQGGKRLLRGCGITGI